jgi:hypothetical protein
MKKVEYTKKRNPKFIFFEWRIRKISNRISEIIRIFEKKGLITKIATTLMKTVGYSIAIPLGTTSQVHARTYVTR